MYKRFCIYNPIKLYIITVIISYLRTCLAPIYTTN